MAVPSNVQAGGVFDPTRDVVIAGQIRSSGSAGGLGYLLGTGSSVTQLTNRTTAVTINALCGSITTNNTSLAAEAAAEFTVSNNLVEIGDVVVASQRSGSNGGDTMVYVSTTAAGSFKITVANHNPAAGTAETGAIIINFIVLKAHNS